MTEKIPVTVLVMTKNEEAKIVACLRALDDFDEVIVVDSQSRDRTVPVAESCKVRVVPFVWDGRYPKKRQWCLDHLPIGHDWVFFVDADEMVTPALIEEIAALFEKDFPEPAGYFVTGRYQSKGKVLRFGLPNRKIALFDRKRMHFPVVDDLDLPSMGEIEGHYQPVLKNEAEGSKIGKLSAFLIHDALDDERAWAFRHEKYARWEAGMNGKDAWPVDPDPSRERVKRFLRASRYRAELVFFSSYILKFGFLDGEAGKVLALGKYRYYKYIRQS